MSDAEDDYLSDKFLLAETVAPATSKSITYAERRRQAQREAETKNVQNRKKSRRELEEESRREGLGKSLFERAKEEEQTGASQGNKAIAMMMKMGFKPGQSLGRVEDTAPKTTRHLDSSSRTSESEIPSKTSGHLVEPLPLDVWSGRQGVGKRKRAVSPTIAGKLAKVVQQADEEARGSFRDRARQEYEERRAEGRLFAATQTCVTLDEKAGKAFNVFWLNPQDPETFPPDLLEALTSDFESTETLDLVQSSLTHNDHLRQRMRADALQPLPELEDNVSPSSAIELKGKDDFPQQIVEEARAFIRMDARHRLELVLAYLRDEYFYCFWCGTQYTDLEDLQHGCPGLQEDDHD